MSDGVFIRASGMYDMHLADEFVYQFGTGLRLNRVAGFGQSIYDMTIDYTYHVPLSSGRGSITYH